MSLEFKDIGAWTPSSVSIVDVPYHPLAYFEVYENDDEFVKKFQEINEVDEMSNQNDEKKITVSESFFEKLLGRSVLKRDPEPQPQPPQNNNNDGEEVSNAEILVAIKKFDERLTAIEKGKAIVINDESNEDDSNNDEGPQNETNPEGNENNSQNESGEATPKTVELPLNDDGTLNMDDGVVAKYLPRGTGNSQALDGDIVRGTVSEKSFNERSGRDENGMSW